MCNSAIVQFLVGAEYMMSVSSQSTFSEESFVGAADRFRDSWDADY